MGSRRFWLKLECVFASKKKGGCLQQMGEHQRKEEKAHPAGHGIKVYSVKGGWPSTELASCEKWGRKILRKRHGMNNTC